MMKSLIERFPQQLNEACSIGEIANLTPHNTTISNIVVLGMGGSGFGADMVKNLTFTELQIPFEIVKGYEVPAFINENSLVIASSYSGNTEETLFALQAIKERNAKIICVTTGGKLKEIAMELHYDYIEIPARMPPRSCLGYSFIQQFYILNYFGLIDKKWILQVQALASFLEQNQIEIKKEAYKIAESMINKFPIIYTFEGYGSIGLRWQQQINENGKMLCHNNTIPEMNHNELVAWRNNEQDKIVIFLNSEDVFYRNKKRGNINQTIIELYCSNILHVNAKGENVLQRSIYLVHFGDWVSQFIADIKQIDSYEVKVLDFLKNEMNKLA